MLSAFHDRLCRIWLNIVPRDRVDLTAASIVHLIEPHWNPMVEAQAVDRVYRIGQMQEVTVIRYIVPDSVETVSAFFYYVEMSNFRQLIIQHSMSRLYNRKR